MTRLQKLRQLARDLHAHLEAARNAAVDDDNSPRLLTADERAAQDEGLAQLDGYAKDIAAEERAAVLSGGLAAADADVAVTPADGDVDGDETRNIVVGDDRWLRRGFPTFGEQLQAIRAGSADGVEPDKRLLHLNATGGDPELRVATGLSETVPGDGGFQLQKDFQTAIRSRAHDSGQILSRVTFTPLSQSATGLKFNIIKEDSRVDGSRGGGVRGYWTDEAAAFTASQPELRQVELSLSKLTLLMYTTGELLADAPALGQKALDGFGEEMRFKTEDSFWSGDGSGKPLGVETASGTISVAKESGQAAATIVAQNIVKMYSRARGRQNAVWFINQDIEPQLYLMSLAVGSAGGSHVYMPAGGLSATPYATLLGRPVVPVEFARTLGTVGDIMLADWSAYEAIDKGSPETAQSMHVRFLFDEEVFRAIYRVDGQPTFNSALTPYQGSTTTGHFVTLATRS